MKDASDVRGKNKTVFVVGGSAGLGKEISKVLASQGAHITIFARRQNQLDEAKTEISAVKQDDSQTVTAIAADMSIASKAHAILGSQPQLPDILYCVAGGSPNECGFLLDLEPEVFERCMSSNYYSSLYPTQAMLKMWTEDDKNTPIPPPPNRPKLRKIIYVNSCASLAPIPGYLAYSAAKCAQRALADTMRLEATRYSGPISTYTIQCIFANNFITPNFLHEQKSKPELTKRIEGTTGSLSELEKRYPYPEKIAPAIVAAVAKGDFAIMDTQMDTELVWANGVGISPKRGWGIVDSVLGVLMGIFIFPFYRRWWERMCRGDALREKEE